MIGHIWEGMMVTDKDGIILYVNSSFQVVAGCMKAEVVGNRATSDEMVQGYYFSKSAPLSERIAFLFKELPNEPK